MPKDDTNKPVTDDQSSVSAVGTTPIPSTNDSSSIPSSTSTPPPISVLEDVVVPPMVTAESSDSGSAAPVSDVVMPDATPMETTHIASTPRKKTMGGKVIATILGLFLLVGGVGAGLFLVQQNQNIGEKAACTGGSFEACRRTKGRQVCECECNGNCTRPDSPGATNAPGGAGCSSRTSSTACSGACHSDGTSACKWQDGQCKVSAQGCDTGGGGAGSGTRIVSCTADNEPYIPCGVTPDGCGGFCIQGGSSTCDDMLRRECNFEPVRGANYQTVALGANCPAGFQSATCTCNIGSGQTKVCFDRGLSTQCGTSDGSDQTGLCAVYKNSEASGGTDGDACGTTNTYYCPGSQDTSGGCQQNANNRPDNFCGTIQVDTACQGFTSTYIPCDTNSTNPPATNPPTPSPTPLITAQCQNVKAYSESWALLTPAQLTALRPTNKVNFCVTGVTTGGSFNKARFTINGVLQPETTTVRPGSTDFCQLYTIPSGTTTFNVTAQINHVTLGWK